MSEWMKERKEKTLTTSNKERGGEERAQITKNDVRRFRKFSENTPSCDVTVGAPNKVVDIFIRYPLRNIQERKQGDCYLYCI